MMDLFIDDKGILATEFEKTARPDVKLPDDPDNWTTAILDGLYAQAPYLSMYGVDIDLSNLDKEAATAYGYAVVSSKVEKPMNAEEVRRNKERDLNIKKIRIPIIIKSGSLKPFDIFLYGGTPEPLTERRVRIALFRPDTFGSIIEDKQQEHLSYTTNSAQMGLGSPYKLASALKHVVTNQDFADWNEAMEKDPHLKEAALNNKAVFDALDVLSSNLSINKTASVHNVLEHVEPTAVQFWYDGIVDNYMLKKASRKQFYPITVPLGRKQAINLVGPTLVKRADMGETQTLNMEEAIEEPVEPASFAPIEMNGTYKLLKDDGSEIIGWVFNDTRRFDGTPLTYKVMTNGEAGAIQEQMLGVQTGEGTTPPGGPFEGFGIFHGLLEGEQVCFQPCTIIEHVMFPEGYKIKAEVFGEGGILDFLISDGVEKPVFTGERWLIPDTYGWSPIGKIVPLAEEMVKKASAERDNTTVNVIHSGTSFSFSGPPVEKIATQVQDLDRRDAEFIAALLGHKNKFAEIAGDKIVFTTTRKLTGCLPINSAEDFYSQVKTATANYRERVNEVGLIPVNLLKEATFLHDPDSIDAVLSLNFINPENLAIFMEYKKTLDDATKKLAELLLAVRVGIRELPEGAILNAMHGLDRVIVALEKLDNE